MPIIAVLPNDWLENLSVNFILRFLCIPCDSPLFLPKLLKHIRSFFERLNITLELLFDCLAQFKLNLTKVTLNHAVRKRELAVEK